MHKQQLALRFGVNESRGTVDLGKRLQNVASISLVEYAIRNPNGGALAPATWTVNLSSRFVAEQTGNTGGRGHVIIVDDAALTHHEYLNPRIITRSRFPALDRLDYRITDHTGAAAAFDEMVLFLEVTCYEVPFDTDQIMRDHHDTPVDNVVNAGRVPGELFPVPVNSF